MTLRHTSGGEPILARLLGQQVSWTPSQLALLSSTTMIPGCIGHSGNLKVEAKRHFDTPETPAKMQIYDKPVRLLMRDMAAKFNLNLGQTFTKQQAIDWFGENYPKIKTGTITAHLIRLSTNTPNRVHYNPKPIEDDFFFQLDSKTFRLYDPKQDPMPLRNADGKPGEKIPPEEEDSEPLGSAEFAYESDLRSYLAKNLTAIEPGLKLYEEEDIKGIEFPVGGRFIDILGVDSNGGLVVIELKVSRGYDRVVGQLMRYMAWIRKNQADAGQKVRGIIVARTISDDLLLACSLVAGVQLFEYELSLTLKKVDSEKN